MNIELTDKSELLVKELKLIYAVVTFLYDSRLDFQVI
jgi:hypothetical protein